MALEIFLLKTKIQHKFYPVIEKTWSFHFYSNSTTSSSRASLNLTTKLVFKKQHKKNLKPKMCLNDTF
jgi:hypothetical protein